MFAHIKNNMFNLKNVECILFSTEVLKDMNTVFHMSSGIIHGFNLTNDEIDGLKYLIFHNEGLKDLDAHLRKMHYEYNPSVSSGDRVSYSGNAASSTDKSENKS